jgi:hypothetical protein
MPEKFAEGVASPKGKQATQDITRTPFEKLEYLLTRREPKSYAL